MSTPPDPAAAPPASTPPADPPKTEQRLDKIETEQARQGTILEQILTKVGAAPAGDGKVTPGSTEQAPADIAEQMRQAIRDVGAEQEAARQAAAHDADHQQMRTRPEQRPRERRTPLRARLQKTVFGIDDSPGSGKQQR
jgi:hypothetical protein